MPDRDFRLYIEDMLGAIQSIQDYCAEQSQESFRKDKKTVDAVIRNLEILGEAAKHVPESTRKQVPEIEWNKIAGFRDVLSHQYFGINLSIIWDVIVNKLPGLRTSLKKMLSEK